MINFKTLEAAAYEMESVYQIPHMKRDAAVKIVKGKFPAFSDDVLLGMWFACDAYADMENVRNPRE